MLRNPFGRKNLSERDRARARLRAAAEPPPPMADAAAEPLLDDTTALPLDPLLAHDTLGQALKAVRLERGLTLEAVAEITRVRRMHLEAIEAMALDALPSRPFTIGYVRAFAAALGLDGELAVERFRTEEPVFDETLHAPVGLDDNRDPRAATFIFAGLVMVAAIVVWNIAQRAMRANAPPPHQAPEAVAYKALQNLKSGPMTLGVPLPAPVESTTPPAYETPGLANAMGLPSDPTAIRPRADLEAPPVDLASLPSVFAPKGRVYDSGNPQIPSSVTVQALKNGSLIVRGTDGSVYFARQLMAGEAYRVPAFSGLTLDVSEPRDFQVFIAGRSAGVLPAAQVLASKLVAPTVASNP